MWLAAVLFFLAGILFTLGVLMLLSFTRNKSEGVEDESDCDNLYR